MPPPSVLRSSNSGSELGRLTSKPTSRSLSVRLPRDGLEYSLFPLYHVASSLRTIDSIQRYQESYLLDHPRDESSGTSLRPRVCSDRRLGGCCSLENLLAYVVPDALEIGLTSSNDVTRQFDNFFLSLHDVLLDRSTDVGRMEEYMFHDLWKASAINRFKSLLSKTRINKKSHVNDFRNSISLMSEEMISRASGIVRNLQDTCYILGYKLPVKWDAVFIRYFLLDMGDFSITNLKYHSLWLSGRLRNCYPKRKASVIDIDGFLIDVQFRKTCLQVLSRNGSRSWLWSETLLQGLKRGFPSMSSSQAASELKSFVSEMEKPLATSQRLIDAVIRTSAEIFRDLDLPSQPFVFSHSAGVHAPCSDFGMYGRLLRLQHESYHTFLLLSDELVKMHEVNGVIEEVRSSIPDPYWQRWHDTLLSKVVQDKLCDTIPLEMLVSPEIDWMEVRRHVPFPLEGHSYTSEEVSAFLEGSPCLGVEASGIFEPLKLRVITKGDPEFYSLLKPLQVAMWTSLRSYRNFDLIGERLGLETLEQLTLGPGGRMFESGDYVGSTNNLSLSLTMACVSQLPTPFLRDLATLTVGPQWLIEPAGKEKRLVKTDLGPSTEAFVPVSTLHLQRRGQFMGSPISFPILCIINAAVARLAFELRHNRSFSLEELPFLINGDDFLARWDVETHDIWNVLVQEVGWELSPGKSFFSDKFIQINSESKKVIWRTGHDGFDRPFFDTSVPYVNMGFVEMLGKDVVSLTDPVKESFSPGWEERFRWLRLCGHEINSRALDIFRRNLDDIRSRLFISPPSISLPPSLGGLGIPLDYPTCSYCAGTKLWSVYKRCPCCLNCELTDYVPFSLSVYKLTPLDSFWSDMELDLETTLNCDLEESDQPVAVSLKKGHQWSGYREVDASWHQENEGWDQVESWMDRVEALREPKEQAGLRDGSRLGRVPYSCVEYLDKSYELASAGYPFEGSYKFKGGLLTRYVLDAPSTMVLAGV